jgi:uncharacterized protein YhjY with autotransporter beta-barrel domain
MRPNLPIVFAGCAALIFGPVAFATSGTDALTAQFDAVCAGAAPGSALAARCAVVQSSPDPNARAQAADFNDLEEIPGAGRGAAHDQWPSRDEVRSLLTPKLAVFASVDHSHSFRSNDSIEAAFDTSSTTLTVGLDWHPADRWQLGLTLNHAHENQDFRGSMGRTDTNTTGAIAVASFDVNDRFAVNGYAGRTQGSQDIRRVVNFIDGSAPVAETASPDLARTLGGVALDASIPHGSLEWRGSLGLDAARTSIDGYAERGGSGFELIVPRRTIQTERGRIDAALAGTFSESWGIWQPEVRVGLLHEFDNDARVVDVRFVQDSNGTVVSFDTGAPDRDWAQATLSSTFTLPHGNSGFVTIGREFGHSTSTAATYAIGWRIEL